MLISYLVVHTCTLVHWQLLCLLFEHTSHSSCIRRNSFCISSYLFQLGRISGLWVCEWYRYEQRKEDKQWITKSMRGVRGIMVEEGNKIRRVGSNCGKSAKQWLTVIRHPPFENIMRPELDSSPCGGDLLSEGWQPFWVIYRQISVQLICMFFDAFFRWVHVPLGSLQIWISDEKKFIADA